MKRNIRKTVIAVFACMLALSGLAGCSSSLDGAEVVAEVGDVKIPLGVANFYARYMYQLMYDSYYMEWYGEDLWEQEWTEGETLEETTKQEAVDSLKRMYILDAVKDDYGVSLTEEDEEAIRTAAKGFMEDNSDDALTAMTATEDHIVEFLSVYTTSERVTAVIKSDVDTEVSDEEAAQKSMSYVTVQEQEAAEDADTEEDEAEDAEVDLEADAQAIVSRVRAGEDFTEVVTELGYTATPSTFDSDSEYPTEDVVAAADELKEGEVTEVIEGEGDIYYVAYLESEFDEAATETKKETIITEREQDLFDEVYEELEEQFDFTLHKKVWAKVSFLKQGVTYVVPEEEETETDEDTDDTDVDDDTDESGESTDDTDTDGPEAEQDETDDADGTDEEE